MLSTCKLAIAAADVRLRNELVEIGQSSGHHVVIARASVPAARETRADMAIVQGSAGDQRPWPEVPTIMVLDAVDPRTVTAALREGVAGVVTRSALRETLTATIAAVACGQLCVPREFAGETERPTLSTREKQILGMVVLGFANVEIAGRLHVAESTVKSHLNSAFRKLGVRSRVEATNLILNPETGLGPGILTIPTTDSETSIDSPAR